MQGLTSQLLVETLDHHGFNIEEQEQDKSSETEQQPHSSDPK